jgi:hypothetical protein
MKIDRQHVPIDTIELVDKKVLVRPYSADKVKGKNILSLVTLACQIYRVGRLLEKAMDRRKANKIGGIRGHGALGMPKFKCFGGEGRDKQKGKKSKVTFEQLLAKYHKQIEAKDVDQTGNAKSSRAYLKPSKSPPKRKSRDQDWRGEEFHASATYPPFGPPILMQYGSTPSYFHPYPSWGWYDSNAYSSSYFRPHNVEYSSHFNSDFEKRSYDKDRFIYKNRSRAQNKNRMVKQDYVVKKDNRKAKSSNLNCITKPEEVLDTSATSTQTIEKLASDSLDTKSELKNLNVPKQPRSPLGLSIWHKRLEKLSAQELKKRGMTWAHNGSSQDPGKDDAFGRSGVKANKRKKTSTRLWVKGLHQLNKAIGHCIVHIFQLCHIRRPKVCSVILYGIILLHMRLYIMEECNRIIMHMDSCDMLLLT